MIKKEISKTATINKILKNINLVINTNREYFEEIIDEETGEKIIQGRGILNKDVAEPKINNLLINLKEISINKYVKLLNHKNKNCYFKVIDVKTDYYPIGCSIIFYCKKVNNNLTFDKTIKKFAFYCTPHRFITEKELVDNFKKKWTADYSIQDKHLYILKNEVGRIKIGQAINVNKRLKCILAQSGIKVEIIRIVERGAIFERPLLNLFKSKNFHGEWFDLNTEEINFLLQTIANNFFKHPADSDTSVIIILKMYTH
jgi:hypothetical protein